MKEGVLSSATVGEAVRAGAARLSSAGLGNTDWEAREMMAAVLKDAAAAVPLRANVVLSDDQRSLWEKFLTERAARKPLAYVLGEWNFRELVLEVTPDVLVPRPETEELFEWMAATLPARVLSVADVGTGSGCLAVALAKRYPGAFLWAIDVSPAALRVARRNAAAHGVARRVYFLEGDLLSRFSPSVHLDAVVANLPYVREEDMAALEPEVRREPALALNGGKEGLDLIRRLVVQSWERLPDGGRLYMEVGHDQAVQVALLLRDMGFRRTEVRKDFAGIERFVMGEK